MSSKETDLEKFVEEVLKKFMADRAMSKGVHALSTRGLQDSPSTRCHYSHFIPATKQRGKHHDDLANVKQIPSILLDYIPPLAGVINHGNILREFEYTLIIMYISKGICVVGS